MLKRVVLSVATLTLAAFVLIGCGGPPKELIEKATVAMKKATEAKADVYAKEAFDAANAALNKGAEAVKKSDWDGAKKAYTEAAAQFEAAAKAAPEAMKAKMEEAKAGIAAAKKAWEDMGKDKMLMAATKLMKKDDKAKYDAMGKEVEGAVKGAEGMMETDPMGALSSLAMATEKMDAMKKMAMPAKK
ncbi:MAG TPA: hypothetical protein PKJ64_08760 [bacterium]|nr:hypothetical protein [bacterium]HMW36630.1 hypothetical protein [bacterium]HMY35977.1 hypothetical protein [bacterium]HNB57429.1 hypothetical protein [bacterium]HNH33823.1 hypothetical protein [bacterium]